jgi:hypothetical protein
MLLMGIASPVWMRAIDTVGPILAGEPAKTESLPSTNAKAAFGPDFVHTDETVFVIPSKGAKK